MVSAMTVMAAVALVWVVAVALCTVLVLKASDRYRLSQDDERGGSERRRLRDLLRDDSAGWAA